MWWVAMAAAGSGPWVPGSGVGTLYLGVDGERFERVKAIQADGAETLELADGITTLTIGGLVSYGFGARFEADLYVPYRSIDATTTTGGVCEELPNEPCRATRTLGVIEARMKGLVLDELSGAPLSVAIGGVLHLGTRTKSTRHRLTNAGEGTIDIGPRLAVGRSGGLGSGYYTISGDFHWVYRIPNTAVETADGDILAPGSEFAGSIDAIASSSGAVGAGLYTAGLWRPSGYDFADLAIDNTDRFAALRVANVHGGAKLFVRDAHDHVLVLSIGHTLYGRNNPIDRWTFGAGVSLNDVFGVLERRSK